MLNVRKIMLFWCYKNVIKNVLLRTFLRPFENVMITLCVSWESALALTLSVSVRTRASSAVRHAGVCPLSACLAMVHVACLVWPPTPRGRPSVTSYAYGLFKDGAFLVSLDKLFHFFGAYKTNIMLVWQRSGSGQMY